MYISLVSFTYMLGIIFLCKKFNLGTIETAVTLLITFPPLFAYMIKKGKLYPPLIWGITWVTTLLILVTFGKLEGSKLYVSLVTWLAIIALNMAILHGVTMSKTLIPEILLTLSTFCYFTGFNTRLSVSGFLTLVAWIKPSENPLFPNQFQILRGVSLVLLVLIGYFMTERHYRKFFPLRSVVNILYGVFTLIEINELWYIEWLILDYLGLALSASAIIAFLLIKMEFSKKNLYLIRQIYFRATGALIFVPFIACLLYTSPSPRDLSTSRMPSSA